MKKGRISSYDFKEKDREAEAFRSFSCRNVNDQSHFFIAAQVHCGVI